jgi:hypothetical protein
MPVFHVLDATIRASCVEVVMAWNPAIADLTSAGSPLRIPIRAILVGASISRYAALRLRIMVLVPDRMLL